MDGCWRRGGGGSGWRGGLEIVVKVSFGDFEFEKIFVVGLKFECKFGFGKW